MATTKIENLYVKPEFAARIQQLQVYYEISAGSSLES